VAKYAGLVGFAESVEVEPGVWIERITERRYRGDVRRMARRLEESGKINPDIVASHEISIIADAFAMENLFAIRYVSWQGTKWSVGYVEVARPRLNLQIGKVYNGSE